MSPVKDETVPEAYRKQADACDKPSAPVKDTETMPEVHELCLRFALEHGLDAAQRIAMEARLTERRAPLAAAIAARDRFRNNAEEWREKTLAAWAQRDQLEDEKSKLLDHFDALASDRERLQAALTAAEGERDIRRMAMQGTALRYANPFAFCPICGGAMRWTAETILRCERDISHTVAVAGGYTHDAQIVQNEPPIHHPEVATPEMFAKLSELNSRPIHDSGGGV